MQIDLRPTNSGADYDWTAVDTIQFNLASAVADVAHGGTVGMAAMGKVMAAIRPQLAGRADMSLVSAKVKSRLNG